MGLLEFLVLLLIAGILGSLGAGLAGSSSGGCLLSIALGFVGALVGTWIARGLDLPPLFVLEVGGMDLPVVWSIIGAALFVAVLRLVGGGRPPA